MFLSGAFRPLQSKTPSCMNMCKAESVQALGGEPTTWGDAGEKGVIQRLKAANPKDTAETMLRIPLGKLADLQDASQPYTSSAAVFFLMLMSQNNF